MPPLTPPPRHNLDNCFDIDKAAFTEAIGAEGMAKLTAFYDTFKELDGVKEYLARRQKVWGLPGSRAQPTESCPSRVQICPSRARVSENRGG